MRARWLAPLLAIACTPRASTRPPENVATAASPEPAGASAWWANPETACPPGSELIGAPPPEGDRVWCARSPDLQHGRATVFYANGNRRSDGELRDGKRVGIWTEYFENGNWRESGSYRDGEREGPWVFWYVNGHKGREGSYRGGQEHGKWTEWDEHGNVRHADPNRGRRFGESGFPHVIGIPECDEYVARYRRCIEEKIPEAGRDAARQAFDQVVKGWTQMPEAARAGLTDACVAALEAVSATCGWERRPRSGH